MPEGGSGAEVQGIQVLEGSTFMLSDATGDVVEGSLAGLFHEDTRYLSQFILRVGGERPFLLSSGTVSYDSAAFFLTNPELPGIPARSLSIQRYRFVGDGLNEVVLIQSHVDAEVRVELRVGCGVDFADLFEVKRETFEKRGTFGSENDGEHTMTFEYRHRDFIAGSRVHSSEPARIDGEDLVFDVVLAPRATWKTRIQVAVRQGGTVFTPLTEEERAASRALQQWRESSKVLQRWRDGAPRIESGWDLPKLIYEQSIADLAALRLYAEVEGNEFALPAAGLPWFMAIFGRDTLVTSYQSLLVGPELARGALKALAGLQGKEENAFKDEEPGKILHEIRFGELTVLGEMPHRPYYGTADATPLFLILLSEYWRLTRDDGTVLELKDHALRALEWIDRYGDRDGDGYVEYGTRSSRGLRNQGWKDSWNGVLFADGTVAEPPIAMCEIQGYVYDAKSRMAELAERVWGAPDVAARLRQEVKLLHDRFNEDFWVEDAEHGGYYIEALDGEKRKVDAVTSDMGHLLWSGIVPPERARQVVRLLFSEAMFSGWGVRTLSSDNRGFNPITYHNGTVWPHDNSLIAAGLYRYGFRAEANRIAVALFDVAGHTDYRLPEVLAGYRRSESGFPVRYPTACSPQAWATAAPFLLLRLMLGVEGSDGVLTADPVVPRQVGKLTMEGLHAFGRRWLVTGEGSSGSVAAMD
jgi:glycogen debranching enzyme